MKRNKLSIILLAGLFFVPRGAFGVITNCMGIVCPDDSWTSANSLPQNCASYTDYCYGTSGSYTRVYDCQFCNSGYTIQDQTVSASGCSNQIEADTCVQSCTGCSDCTSDTSWSAGNTGYEKKVTRTCNCNTCTASTSYRCAAGYYGSSTNGTSGCTSCTTATSNDNATSAAGSTAITSCYIPSETSMTDDSGTYEYTSDCYYSE